MDKILQTIKNLTKKQQIIAISATLVAVVAITSVIVVCVNADKRKAVAKNPSETTTSPTSESQTITETEEVTETESQTESSEIETETTVLATAITLDKESLTLKVGNSDTLTVTITPEDTTESVSWSTSDANLVSVENGKVTAIKAGSAVITAQIGTVSATCQVTVEEEKKEETNNNSNSNSDSTSNNTNNNTDNNTNNNTNNNVNNNTNNNTNNNASNDNSESSSSNTEDEWAGYIKGADGRIWGLLKERYNSDYVSSVEEYPFVIYYKVPWEERYETDRYGNKYYYKDYAGSTVGEFLDVLDICMLMSYYYMGTGIGIPLESLEYHKDDIIGMEPFVSFYSFSMNSKEEVFIEFNPWVKFPETPEEWQERYGISGVKELVEMEEPILKEYFPNAKKPHFVYDASWYMN